MSSGIGETGTSGPPAEKAPPSNPTPESQVTPAQPAPLTAAPTAPTERKTGPKSKTWQLAVLVIVAMVVGGVAVTLFGRPSRVTRDPRTSTPPPAATAGHDEASAPSVSGLRTAPPPASRWTRGRYNRYASDGTRTAAFELEAERAVPVWMKSVRPVLGVRCFSRNTEVFVVIDWPASVEPAAGRHTVRIGFDDGDAAAQAWFESDNGQALFAPDGVAMSRRLARARTMRFGFTPYNAPPVVAEFDVTGVDEVIESVARACRWKL